VDEEGHPFAEGNPWDHLCPSSEEDHREESPVEEAFHRACPAGPAEH